MDVNLGLAFILLVFIYKLRVLGNELIYEISEQQNDLLILGLLALNAVE
jgi:hypothetical protein